MCSKVCSYFVKLFDCNIKELHTTSAYNFLQGFAIMSKVKIAFFSNSYKKPLPNTEDMKKKLNAKNIVELKTEKKNPKWTLIEKNDTFVWDVIQVANDAFGIDSQYMPHIFAFSDDVNSSMLGLLYGEHIEAYTTIDRNDIENCTQIANKCLSIEVMIRHFDNVIWYKNFVDEVQPTQAVIKKLEAMDKADEKNAKYFQSLKDKELKKLKMLLTKGWD